MFFKYDHLEFRYVPFPIGLARPIMESDTYQQLLDAWPPMEYFTSLSKVGSKYTLSEKFNPEQYHKWIDRAPVWRRFHAWVKSDAFIGGVMEALRERNVDLGYEVPLATGRRLTRRLGDFLGGRDGRYSVRLRSRFEFSMLPANGGHVLPHTDGISKLVTLVVSMVGEDEWKQAYGGGTDLNQPKDASLSFNRMNRQLSFEDVQVLETFEFAPNQAVVFVKTFNSWHSVRPMTAEEPDLMRRTLTINIEVP